MDEALSHWLRLREPADFAARSEALARATSGLIGTARPVRLLDLGTGTGSNIRYLADRLPASQDWLAVDRSHTLLSDLHSNMLSWGVSRGYEVRSEGRRCTVRGTHLECEVETRQQELGTLEDHEIFAGRHVVTASALLDLVSEAWLAALASHCRREGALALVAITYNGRFDCTPVEAADEEVRDLMNRHQKTDKGFGGPSVGPDAGACAERCFTAAGYRVRREASDWSLGPGEADVQRLLIEGWAQAATDMATENASRIARWRARRLAHVAAHHSRIVVGHDDLAAWPTDRVAPG